MSCSINSKDYFIVSSIYFISGQFAKLFCQVITKLLILCTRTGIQNKCQKNMGCISVQHKCCLHSMVAVTCLLLASLTSKCADTSDGTASALAIFVCLYQQNLFWYQQDPYIPTGAKLYLQNPKGTHTVSSSERAVDGQPWRAAGMNFWNKWHGFLATIVSKVFQSGPWYSRLWTSWQQHSWNTVLRFF